MGTRVTPSQFRRLVRKAQQKTRQATDKYNRDVRTHNHKVKQAVDSYNREVRVHNARVRSDRQRLQREIPSSTGGERRLLASSRFAPQSVPSRPRMNVSTVPPGKADSMNATTTSSIVPNARRQTARG